jgi:BirA family transcriptional regulator, biotin operon repressor / biotin---[acetyl-CoA-carboxylase] ligase
MIELPGRRIHWHESIDSTMYEAVRLAAAGAPSGTVVGADEQTAGHGRYNRPWHSERGAGLYFSLILRLPIETAALPVITLALGCAAVEAVEITTGITCDLRWPNDVLIADRKCAGILTQFHNGAVVAGIGINVNQARFPPELSDVATSLRIASGREHPRENLLAAILDDIDRHAGILVRQGPAAILDLFTQASSYVSGRRVEVDLPDGAVTGTTAGLTESGFLKLRLHTGAEQIIIAGGVRPCS